VASTAVAVGALVAGADAAVSKRLFRLHAGLALRLNDL